MITVDTWQAHVANAVRAAVHDAVATAVDEAVAAATSAVLEQLATGTLAGRVGASLDDAARRSLARELFEASATWPDWPGRS